MSFESSTEAERELRTLTDREIELSLSVLQHTSTTFREAWIHHSVSEPYVREFVVATPVPSLAFRLDSKDAFSVDTNKPGVKRITKERHHVFVPRDWAESDSTYPANRMWFRRFEPGSRARMYVVERELLRPEQASIRRHSLDAEMRAEMRQFDTESSDDTPTYLEFSMEDILRSMNRAIEEKRVHIEELEHLKNAMLGDSEVVPFDK